VGFVRRVVLALSPRVVAVVDIVIIGIVLADLRTGAVVMVDAALADVAHVGCATSV
jgi:hypothetical protein